MGWEELSQSERPEKWNRQGKRLVWGGRQAATAFTGVLLECPFWPPLTVVLAAVPFPAWHLGEKAWDPDRLSGLQGEVLQVLRELGPLPQTAGSGRQTPVTLCLPSSHHCTTPVTSLPGDQLLITAISHVSHLTLHKSRVTSSNSRGASSKTEVEQNETIPLIPATIL